MVVLAQIDPVMGVVMAAVIASLSTYLVAARTLSGRIKNSDATELWAESRSIREWSAERIRELIEQIDLLEKRLGDVEAANNVLADKNRELTTLLNQERAKVVHLKQWAIERAARGRYFDPPDEQEAGGSE